MNLEEIMQQLRALGNPDNIAGMVRYGINPRNALGVSVAHLRRIARHAGHDHLLAQELWASGIHEARTLASMVDRPEMVSPEQMERWVLDIDSWDVCDQVCGNLFDKTPWAWAKAAEWSARSEEFVKRAGFVLVAALALHDPATDDAEFERFLTIIQREATDERNYVRKAVNWALRAIGKRNRLLHGLAIQMAETIQQVQSRTARWIAADALRELNSAAVCKRLAATPDAAPNARAAAAPAG